MAKSEADAAEPAARPPTKASASGRHVKRKHGLTRSKNGCLTCRRRRKKCDGEAPICGHCARLALDCLWPEPLLLPTSSSETAGDGAIDADHRPTKRRRARKARSSLASAGASHSSPDERGSTSGHHNDDRDHDYDHDGALLRRRLGCEGEGEGEDEIHRAAEALLIGREMDLFQPTAGDHCPAPVLGPPFPYGVSRVSPGTDAVAVRSMVPTQEDLEAAQWLSSYSCNRVLERMHMADAMSMPFETFPYDDAKGVYSYHDAKGEVGDQDGDLAYVDEGHLRHHGHHDDDDNDDEHDDEKHDAQQTHRQRHDLIISSPEDEQPRFFGPGSPFEHVGHDTRILLDYFETEFAQLISVAPRTSNNLLLVFLPMAVDNEGVRDALAGWSATHLRDIDDRFETQSCTYLRRAADWLDAAAEDPIERDRDATLAVALIICAVEVCKDTDSQWARYRRLAHDIIKRRGLVHAYSGRDQIFLLKNFAYHDVMSSSEPGRPLDHHVESHTILSRIPNVGGPDCYMGICTPLYALISECTALSARARREHWSPRTIATHASRLIVAIDTSDPSPSVAALRSLRPEEQAKHASMFRILQLTAKLYINQILLRYNSSSIGSQILIQTVMPLFSSLQTVLVEMLFPLFVVGVDALLEDRKKVGRMMEIMFERFRIGNVRCAYSVLERCWESNAEGEVFVDWNEVSFTLFGQSISLA